MTAPIYNPGQPYMMPIPGGFRPGCVLHITGTMSMNATSIVVKLQSGPYGDPNDEIGLCLYGRVNEGLLGRNSFTRASGWGQEEVSPTQAFARGQSFELAMLCDPYQLKIALNNQHFCEFNHKMNPSSLMHVNVASGANDLTLSCIWIEDTNTATAPPPNPVPYGAPAPGPGYAPPQNQGGYYGNQGPPQQQYPGPPDNHSSKGDKGLLGMVGLGGIGGALSGALMGKKSKGHSGDYNQGYPGGNPGYNQGNPGGNPGYNQGNPGGNPGYNQGNPGGNPGYNQGYPASNQGYPGGHSSGSSGLMNTAMGVGGGLMAAKGAKKAGGGLGGILGGLGGSKALKYGIPLAGAGLGGYALSKGLGKMGGSFGSFDFSDDDDCCGGGGGWGSGSCSD